MAEKAEKSAVPDTTYTVLVGFVCEVLGTGATGIRRRPPRNGEGLPAGGVGSCVKGRELSARRALAGGFGMTRSPMPYSKWEKGWAMEESLLRQGHFRNNYRLIKRTVVECGR